MLEADKPWTRKISGELVVGFFPVRQWEPLSGGVKKQQAKQKRRSAGVRSQPPNGDKTSSPAVPRRRALLPDVSRSFSSEANALPFFPMRSSYARHCCLSSPSQTWSVSTCYGVFIKRPFQAGASSHRRTCEVGKHRQPFRGHHIHVQKDSSRV